MRRSSAAELRARLGAFPSPDKPSHRHGGAQGWSSERVPAGGGLGALLPFGRTLPSKWEDAEKWIFSPVSAHGGQRPSAAAQYHRRPKSKSGPLGPPGASSASPLGGRADFTAGSPLLAGVLVADYRFCGNGGGGSGASYSADPETSIVRSASVHGWSDMLVESSSSPPSSRDTVQDEIISGMREVATIISPVVLSKDMATQMSPEESPNSSPDQRWSSSLSPPVTHPVAELENNISKLEVIDVPVDDRITVTRWSKKHTAWGSGKRSTSTGHWKKKTEESMSCAWEVVETAKCMLKYKREETKITAWENLQKAKAEAAIRKLEMKLEKKRSSSMDKILNKLRSAQRKAQEMRNAVNASQAHQVARSTKRVSYFRRTGQISSLSGCFTCHAF